MSSIVCWFYNYQVPIDRGGRSLHYWSLFKLFFIYFFFLFCLNFIHVFFSILFKKNTILCLFLKNVSPSKRVVCFILNNFHIPMVGGIACYAYLFYGQEFFLMHLVRGWHLLGRKENTIKYLTKKVYIQQR